MAEKREKRIGEIFETKIATSGGPTSERTIHDVLKEGLQCIIGYVPCALLLSTVPLVLGSLLPAEMARTEATLREQT